jgi:hypothetical protein
MFTNDDVNDTETYQDMLNVIVDPDDFLDVNIAYSDYIRWLKLNKPGEVDNTYDTFKQSMNTLPYLDVSTGLVLPLLEIMYLLRIGYSIDAVIKTVATFPQSVEPIILPKRCEAICLSLIWPNRGSNVDLNAIHVEKETWNAETSKATTQGGEKMIDKERTIIAMNERKDIPTYTTMKKQNPFLSKLGTGGIYKKDF